MTFDAVLPLLLGPFGLVVGLLIALVTVVRGNWHTDAEFQGLKAQLVEANARADRSERRLDRTTLAAIKATGAGSALLDVVRERLDPTETREGPDGKHEVYPS